MHKLTTILLSFTFLAGCSFIPTRKDVSDIEKRLYRRIPYEADGDYRIVELFYATDRQVRNQDSELYFDAKMAEQMTVGTLRARIDPGIKIGKVLPDRIKRKGIIGVQDVAKLSEDDFMADLSRAVQNSPHKSVLVLVYGFKDNFEFTAIKAAYFSYLLDVNTPVLLFDWPGDQSVSPWGYKKSEKFAVASGPYLGSILARVIREVKPKKIWIESSSLGCQIVCSAFEWMYQHSDLSDPENEISHVAMVAPDVSKDEFDNKFKDEMSALTDKLTVYVSSNDNALLMAEIIDWEKKIGRQRFQIEKQEQFEEAKDLLYLKSLQPDKISIIDVTPINKASYHHGYDLEASEFYDDFYMRIFDVSAHNNRRLYIMKVNENIDYWIMRSD